MDIVSTRPAALRWVVLAVALVLLNASLTFVNIWPTLRIRLTPALSIEAAACVLAILVLSRWFGALSRRALRWMAVLWVLLVVGRYMDVTTRSLYGRELNLYWDLRLIPDVGSMLAFVANPWLVAGLIAAAVLLPLLIYVPMRWAMGSVADATSDPVARRVLVALSLAVVVAGVGQLFDLPGRPAFTRVEQPVTAVLVSQARQFAYEASGAGVRALPPAPVIDSDLAGVRGADVYLVFIESYGVVSWDRASFTEALAKSRADLAAAIRETGRGVVSSRVESTTFGGESWLAHISLLSGSEVRDQETNVRLMAQKRDTMVTAFSRQGYRTVAAMPGIQRPWPEGAFYGFDQIYGALQLDYHGPPFGWWDITDQFVFAKLDALERKQRKPLFVFFPTISTHTPFTPTPPYQPDWTRALTTQPYDPEDLDRAWSQPPDWLNLGPGYAQSLDYIHATVGGYLRLHANRDIVMILIGDHQPPALITGEGAPWDVPVHVVASRPAILDRLRQHGFKDGLAPPQHSAMKINALLPVLQDAFGED